MTDPLEPTPKRRKTQIADAEHLFREEGIAREPGPAPPGGPAPSGEGYAVESGEPAGIPSPAPAPPELEPEPTRARRPAGPVATVEQPWSRGAEWGPNLILLALVAAVDLFLVYQLFAHDDFGLAFLVLLAGMATLAILSYPIIITLERPVRVTPEQAVTDYYDALSHHLPHYRRMWLLLSSAGRTSSAYGSYEGFKRYWKERLAQLRKGRAGGLTPLAFKIDDFQSEKSAGKSIIDVKCAVLIYVRGKKSEGPIESVRLNIGLVKGPDAMWYLNKGILPGGRSGGES